ncbi:hypothetical protein [Actinacidiphila soli]|jgi:hypothetical protein|uniref:hypothetical protein n=1 Tax=Actinacidiphila soli TaxID=2487275 RepID=UPI0013E3676A|nr:hypothetical protein [Actinacidiphila soli]
MYGLNTSRTYQVTDLNTQSTWQQTGSSLTSTGLAVSLTTAPATTITYTAL